MLCETVVVEGVGWIFENFLRLGFTGDECKTLFTTINAKRILLLKSYEARHDMI
ncbi:hypothetical protein SAMN02746064_01198 [Alkalibacter saccharofermentans DSM 14828]|uniref:Uncharacterized protein n=1 Tax=Alkalibacter saccharofermentans DSM 14828 TaxID=1120975 RepID=A0A1M4WD25_9FIRM|nr:hypothetical protein SAMN02746064_01198 [Alkalibacter saccharofermentans DSM 14828]